MRIGRSSLLCLVFVASRVLAAPESSDGQLMVPQEMPAELNHAAEARTPTALDQEITAFLARYAEAYNREDYAALLEMWDRDDPDALYIAEEIDPPMQGWKLIDAYFARPGVLDGIRCEYSRIRTSQLAPDLAMATYLLRFDIKVKNMKPMSGFDRVVAVFRRKNGEWKMARYVEAPQAPITMVRKFGRTAKTVSPEELKQTLRTIQTLQEEAVAPDFEAWLQSRR